MASKEGHIVPRYAGYIIHRALRRSMDSDASSLLWNAIEVAPDQTWLNILQAIEDTEEDTLKERTETLDWYSVAAIGCTDLAHVNLIKIAFRMLHDQEFDILEQQCQEYYKAMAELQAKEED